MNRKVGRFEGKPQDVNVNEIVEEIVLLYKEQIKETGAIVYFTDLPVVQTFKSPLRQMIQNLLSNALKYYRRNETPVINIEAEQLGEHWKFYVKDNGIGIDPDYYDRIFNIFQRLHNKEEYSGTGIGLAIVKKIVEAMGGEIWIEPNEERGSVFIFTIHK